MIRKRSLLCPSSSMRVGGFCNLEATRDICSASCLARLGSVHALTTGLEGSVDRCHRRAGGDGQRSSALVQVLDERERRQNGHFSCCSACTFPK
eukprot:scaffold32690_cov107-Isochrysis_galbana.AAC.1